jgi:hypothetical protein
VLGRPSLGRPEIPGLRYSKLSAVWKCKQNITNMKVYYSNCAMRSYSNMEAIFIEKIFFFK